MYLNIAKTIPYFKCLKFKSLTKFVKNIKIANFTVSNNLLITFYFQ